MGSSLEIRVLGELTVIHDGSELDLPGSKKTRALLGYLLVARGRPQPRQRLCELFWDGPDDPRAALRWSLTKIRPLVDDGGIVRLVADREHVAFEARGAKVDLASVAETAASLETASLTALRKAEALYRGELLEGLDLPECYRYHEWCVGEREAARRVRVALLAKLTDRLSNEPDDALRYARARVAVDPLAEPAHIAVMQLLARLGRPREAIKQYESCRRVLEAQLGRPPSKELEVARSALGQTRDIAPREPEKPALRLPPPKLLIGRTVERATIATTLREAAAGACRQVLLFSGESGIGKTRLLEEVADQTLAAGGAALAGRAFEAEMVRPYGPWIDVLRSMQPGPIDASLRADLAPLLPDLGAAHGDNDRNRLFDAVGKLLLQAARSAPVVIALDDLQWFDEASAALLHYAARRLADSRVLIACAARSTEIDGNLQVKALLRALTREGRLLRAELPPLDREETDRLVRTVHGQADAAQIFLDGGGNPLYSLELARAEAAAARDGGGAATHTLDALIGERLSRMEERAVELLPWAAALGHAFAIDTLAALTSLPARDLMAGIEELERHGVLRATGAAAGAGDYDFVHDLVRRAAYRMMSEPRRRWTHLHVARTLAGVSDPESSLAADIAHHAALGGDSELAARAYVAGGERCLRLLAYADASRLARSGLQHVGQLPREKAIRLRVALLGVQVYSNQWRKHLRELEGELSRLALSAQQREMHAEAARCYYLMSYVHAERGDLAGAGASSLEAMEAGRSADAETRQLQLANSGRCFAFIERDILRADEFLTEALSLGERTTGRTALEIAFGRGLVLAYKGVDDEALRFLERAADLADIEQDHLVRLQALTRMARLALERSRPREAIELCASLEPLVARMPEGSERPFVAALHALARLDLGEADALSDAERALEGLRAADSKAHVAYVLNALAAHDARVGRIDRARSRAEEALVAAETVGHKSETAVARSHLARLALEHGERVEGLAQLGACGPDWSNPWALSDRARAAVTVAISYAGSNAGFNG